MNNLNFYQLSARKVKSHDIGPDEPFKNFAYIVF